ncbi:MAG TPA: hypothetical protein DCO83_11140, partial [Mucilaginibacter sp.]|nr:hypothetical protein [Mucilaginibacter sp.]
MISYNKTWLDNLRLQGLLKKDLAAGKITPAEFAAITEKYPVGFYTPNLLTRIGLFVLTCIIVFFTDGLLSLTVSSSNIIGNFGWFLFLGLISYIALELIVNLKNHYRSGVDDALLITSGGLFMIALYILLDKNSSGSHSLRIAEIIFIVSLGLSLRFADMLAGAVCTASFFAFILYAWTGIGAAGITSAPFVMMLVSAIVYWLTVAGKKQPGFVNYTNCLVVAQVGALVTLYAAGNYYVVQILGNELKGITDPGNTPLPFGAFFWAWTLLIPFIYTGSGILKKDRILLRTGLILIAAAAVTFRNYYHILPADLELTIIGAIILGIVYGLIRYLKTPKHGFTYIETDKTNAADEIKIESLVVAETFSHNPSAPADGGTKFGGGDFGGGGS